MAQTKALRSKPLPHMDGLPTKRAPYLVCEFRLADPDKLDRSLGQPNVTSSNYLKNYRKSFKWRLHAKSFRNWSTQSMQVHLQNFQICHLLKFFPQSYSAV
jgi:hypothetical protein